MRFAIVGATGRVGLELVRARGSHTLVAAIATSSLGSDIGELAGVGRIGCNVVDGFDGLPFDGPGAAEVIIDFSADPATSVALEFARVHSLPLVSGTTGLTPSTEAQLSQLAETAPVVWAPNFSQGVTLLTHLSELAAAACGPLFDAEILELHHRHKKDAPSGTALRLAQVVTAAKNLQQESWVFGREGNVGARTDEEVGILAVRGGDIVGEHTVMFIGQGERIELVHRATDRGVFARGALRAAAWALAQEPGLYGMADVMGVKRQ